MSCVKQEAGLAAHQSPFQLPFKDGNITERDELQLIRREILELEESAFERYLSFNA